jgi:hypothetical protein
MKLLTLTCHRAFAMVDKFKTEREKDTSRAISLNRNFLVVFLENGCDDCRSLNSFGTVTFQVIFRHVEKTLGAKNHLSIVLDLSCIIIDYNV